MSAIGLVGNDFDAAASELVMKKPGAGYCTAVLLRRFEFPVACRLEGDAREVGAGTVRSKSGISDCATGVDADTDDDADGAVYGVAGALRDIGDVAIEHIAT